MAGGRYGWFPGHMFKALKQMEQRLKLVDIVVEVRDARLPLSSANPDLARLSGRKRRLVVLNKTDLADPAATQAACSLLQSQGLRVVPCVAMRDSSAAKVLDAALGWLQSGGPPSDLSLMMVAGAPNTGKSSLINALKRAAQREGLLEGEQAFHKTARAGPLPGVTRALGGFKVCGNPLLYVLDTPGVLPPSLGEDAVAVRLALAGLMPADAAGLRDEVLVRHLVQILVSEPRHQRQLWMAADGQVAAALQRQRAAAAAAAAAGAHRRHGSHGDDGEGGGGGGGGWRPRESGSVALARALHDVVSMPAPPPPAWHPGMDDASVPFYDTEQTDEYGRPYDNRAGDVGSGDVGSRTDAERRVSALVRQLTRGSVVDLGRRTALLRSVLHAFRQGALGRYTLDDCGPGTVGFEVGATAAAGGGVRTRAGGFPGAGRVQAREP